MSEISRRHFAEGTGARVEMEDRWTLQPLASLTSA
jgi:hypothetical protein